MGWPGFNSLLEISDASGGAGPDRAVGSVAVAKAAVACVGAAVVAALLVG